MLDKSTDMPKILLVSFFFLPKIGGIENSLTNLCQRLPPEKIVVLADKAKGWQEFDQKQSYKIYRADFFGSKFLKPSWLPLVWKIWRIVKKEKIEVILFGHYANYCLIGSLLKKILKIPFLVYGRGVDVLIPQKNKISKFLLRFNLKNAAKVLANSSFTKNEIVKLGVPEERVIVIHPGIDLEKFNENRVNKKEVEKIKKALNLEGRKVILYVGRLAKIKGVDLIIRALPEIKKEVPDIAFVIVGKGEDEENLKKITKELNLEKEVIFAGSVENSEKTLPYYFLADLYAGPSRELYFQGYKHTESFGNTYLEAQAMGKPVIAARVGGVADAVADGQTGILVPADDTVALAQVIVKLLTDNQLKEKFALEAKKWAQKFSWSNQINLLKKIFQSVC